MAGLPPPPINDKPGSFTWLEWYRQLRAYVSTSGSVPWYIINFAGSNITDIANRSHENLQGLQGGTAGEHYHLTAAQLAGIGVGNHNSLLSLQGGTTGQYYHITQAQHDIMDKMTWNTDDGTINLAMNTSGVVSQQIGLETYYRVKNQSGATLANGKVVRAAGTLGASGRIKAVYAIGDGTIPGVYVMGIVTEDIANGDDGYVTNFGSVRGINTTGSPYGETWADGDILYVSATTAGALTNVAPTAPNLKMPVAIVINAATNGTLFVRPTFDMKVNDIQDVNVTTPSNKQVLKYDTATTTWKNTDLATPTTTTGLTLKTTQYLSVDIGGTTYKIALVN